MLPLTLLFFFRVSAWIFLRAPPTPSFSFGILSWRSLAWWLSQLSHRELAVTPATRFGGKLVWSLGVTGKALHILLASGWDIKSVSWSRNTLEVDQFVRINRPLLTQRHWIHQYSEKRTIKEKKKKTQEDTHKNESSHTMSGWRGEENTVWMCWW